MEPTLASAPLYRRSTTDPEFKYPPSRNLYCKKLKEFEGRCFSDQETEHYRGQWRKKFQKNLPLFVELGCNGGHVLIEWAIKNPDKLYLGIDWKFKQIYRATEKARKRDLENLLFLRANQERLPFIFGPEEIDQLFLFFPDPWEKNPQRKKRFVTPERLKEIALLVKPGGRLEIKTDHEDYFEWMIRSTKQASSHWKVILQTKDLYQGHPEPKNLKIPEITLFEKVFILQGKPIHRMILEKI